MTRVISKCIIDTKCITLTHHNGFNHKRMVDVCQDVSLHFSSHTIPHCDENNFTWVLRKYLATANIKST